MIAVTKGPVTRGSFLRNLQCNADGNETLQVAGKHITRCNWFRNVAKSRRFFNFFCILLVNFSLRCKLQSGLFTRNLFCALLRNGVALQVAGKIVSCNRALKL